VSGKLSLVGRLVRVFVGPSSVEPAAPVFGPNGRIDPDGVARRFAAARWVVEGRIFQPDARIGARPVFLGTAVGTVAAGDVGALRLRDALAQDRRTLAALELELEPRVSKLASPWVVTNIELTPTLRVRRDSVMCDVDLEGEAYLDELFIRRTSRSI